MGRVAVVQLPPPTIVLFQSRSGILLGSFIILSDEGGSLPFRLTLFFHLLPDLEHEVALSNALLVISVFSNGM